ncbi:4-hydroxyproline epimerase [Enhydrobacter sp.]|jgi:4-hydroxyproline epimerase|uniref:4-hydroxyproline epimerase n=1 Tax=Enhydrobacter sp. TaxID=1894999 RepID=UPI0026174C10|nr:4-hydroxyproline epimerase [Enhydrobacter sp.]WIM11279.1 MAG: 4-hydroxyproline epimerase [Enhydrobacter sp.]
MALHTFSCLDGHTCGNPVRLVSGGAPLLRGATMSERRLDFLARHDWIRKALMFEPRGHDVMSGSILYPPTRADCDIGILFIEVSGCLPMCGHGTIGTVTMAIENGLVAPAAEGTVALDAPAGRVLARYERDGRFVDSVRLTNVASYLAASDVTIDVPGVGELVCDIAYGGNFYAIVEPQRNFAGLEAISAADVLRLSPIVRRLLVGQIEPVHPEDASIRGVSHVMWTGAPRNARAHARNAVFYGDKAIDRSPCGTGTSARMAQLAAEGRLGPGDEFVHESIIGSLFDGRVEAAARVGNHDAIVPSIAGWARQHGINTIFVDDRDPFAHGFQVT